jgi:hypothetical protein
LARSARLWFFGDENLRRAAADLELAQARFAGALAPRMRRRRQRCRWEAGDKVFQDYDNGRRLVGRAEVPQDAEPVYEVPMFGAVSVIVERFVTGTVTRLPEPGGAPVVERAVLAAPGQLVELLPGWELLAS